jgi:hypothetical protein
VSRDPLEETVGDNIIAFVCNSPLVSYDPFGLWQPGGTINDDRRRIYTKEPGDTWQGLADILELRLEEIHKWAKPYGDWNARDFDPNACRVSVPNVWISADLLQGGGLWDRLVNFGGSAGRFIGTGVLTYGFKIVKPNSVSELMQSLRSYKADTWGVVVFGHGSKDGMLAMPGVTEINARQTEGTLWVRQSRVIQSVGENGYKLARVYAMQCYSAYRGPVAYDDGTIMNFDWETSWKEKANLFYGYQGENIVLIDTGSSLWPWNWW